MPNFNLRHNLPIFALFIVTIAIPLTVIVALPQNADTRSKAYNNGKESNLNFSQDHVSLYPQEEFQTSITLNTGVNLVTAVDLRLSFDPAKIEILSLTPNTTYFHEILTPFSLDNQNQTARIVLGSGTNNKINGSGIPIGELRFKAKKAPGLSTFSLEKSKVSAFDFTDSVLAFSSVLNIEIQEPIKGDLDLNGQVDIFDYNLMIQNFGSLVCGNMADIDHNCKVNIFDYNLLIENFGRSNDVIPTLTPTVTPSITLTPTPTPLSSCLWPNTIWNGTTCKTLSRRQETYIVGLDSPVATRAELEEIEKSFVRISFPGFPENLFTPNTLEKAKQIQDIRLANFLPDNNRLLERSWEFILNQELKDKLDTNEFGSDAIGVLLKHQEAEQQILNSTFPSIPRKVLLKRIIITSNSLFSDKNGGWGVPNDNNIGYWANDTLNNQPGFIPFDIDSRWAFGENMYDLLKNNGLVFNGVKVDYGLVHELTHHLPVGDNYVYNFAYGRGLAVPQNPNKRAIFAWNKLNFMGNDHMTSPGIPKLTAPSSYYINYQWFKNPKTIRNPQRQPYPDNVHPYEESFYDNLIIKITGLNHLKDRNIFLNIDVDKNLKLC